MENFQKEPWTLMNGDERTRNYPIREISCMGCSEVIAKIHDYRYIHLTGVDRKAVIDTQKNTVTVKCRCGTGSVLRARDKYDEGEKENLSVWLQEINHSNGGELQDPGKGVGGSQ